MAAKAYTLAIMLLATIAAVHGASAMHATRFSELSHSTRRLLAFQNVTLPPLPYNYSALEPYIEEEIMRLHHDRHHAELVRNFNIAVANLAVAEDDNDVPAIVKLSSALNFNGGGHLNHAMFWKSLTPPEDFVEVSGALADAINATWGSFEAFQTALTTATIGGSGWGWLALSSDTGGLLITTTPNQNALQPTTGLIPLLGIDIFEHSYYLQYLNVRADYLNAIWNVINWPEVEARYEAAFA